MTFESLIENRGLSKREITIAKKVFRAMVEEEKAEYPKIHNAKIAFEHFRVFALESPEKEMFLVGFLNAQNKIIKTKKLFEGGITNSVVDIRIVFREALLCGATSIILGHNHPSGNTNPSQADVDITHQLQEAGRILKINVLDHIVFSQTQYTSLIDEGMM
jgi:DNA repair protein RadC